MENNTLNDFLNDAMEQLDALTEQWDVDRVFSDRKALLLTFVGIVFTTVIVAVCATALVLSVKAPHQKAKSQRAESDVAREGGYRSGSEASDEQA